MLHSQYTHKSRSTTAARTSRQLLPKARPCHRAPWRRARTKCWGLGIRLAGRTAQGISQGSARHAPDTGGDPKRFTAVNSRGSRSARQKRGLCTTRVAAPRRSTLRSRPRLQRVEARGAFVRSSGWLATRTVPRAVARMGGSGCHDRRPIRPRARAECAARIRHTLADALAEESTARTLAALGIGYTVWHDVSTGAPELKVDHVVLRPSGLFAMLSEDFGGPVRVRRGELIGDGVDRPMHELEFERRPSRANGACDSLRSSSCSRMTHSTIPSCNSGNVCVGQQP